MLGTTTKGTIVYKNVPFALGAVVLIGSQCSNAARSSHTRKWSTLHGVNNVQERNTINSPSLAERRQNTVTRDFRNTREVHFWTVLMVSPHWIRL